MKPLLLVSEGLFVVQFPPKLEVKTQPPLDIRGLLCAAWVMLY